MDTVLLLMFGANYYSGDGPKPQAKTIDAEYESFLAEIGERKPEPAPNGPGAPDATEASYEEFMAAISEGMTLLLF